MAGDNSLNLSQLNSSLGAYCRQNKQDLYAEVLLSQDFSKRFNVMAGVKDQVPLPRLSLTGISKPLDYVNFTPAVDSLVFAARILQVRSVKVDVRIYPQQFFTSWLGQYATPGAGPKLIFEAFLSQEIAKKAREENHLIALYNGVYNGAGTTPNDNYNGWLKIIADEIVANEIAVAKNNFVATGALNAANIIDKLESMYDKLGDQYKTMPSQMLMSPSNAMMYQRAYRTQYGQNQNYTGMTQVLDPGVYLDGTMCQIIPEPGLTGSNRIILSIKENMCYGVDLDSDLSEPRTEINHRAIDVMMDYRVGVQFRQLANGVLVVNDQV